MNSNLLPTRDHAGGVNISGHQVARHFVGFDRTTVEESLILIAIMTLEKIQLLLNVVFTRENGISPHVSGSKFRQLNM